MCQTTAMTTKSHQSRVASNPRPKRARQRSVALCSQESRSTNNQLRYFFVTVSTLGDTHRYDYWHIEKYMRVWYIGTPPPCFSRGKSSLPGDVPSQRHTSNTRAIPTGTPIAAASGAAPSRRRADISMFAIVWPCLAVFMLVKWHYLLYGITRSRC